MAIYFKTTWFGVQAWLDESDTAAFIAGINEARNIDGLVAAGLAAGAAATGGATAPAAVVTGLIAAILTVGAGALQLCDSARRGVILTLLWVGVPWCTGR